MKRLILLLLLISSVCFAQREKTIDSLLTLAKSNFFSDYNKTIALSNRAIRLSHATNNILKEATGYNLKGICYQFKGDIDSALVNLERAHTLVKRINDPVLSGKISGNFGSTYFRIGRYDKALLYGFEGLRMLERAKDTIGIARVTGDIANVFNMQKRYDKAIEYLKRAISLAQKAGDIASLGNFYNSLGATYNDLSKPEDAKDAFQKALKIFKQNNNIKGRLSTTVNVADLDKTLHKPLDMADLLEAEKIAIKLEDKQRLGEIYNILSYEYKRLGNNSEAIRYIGLSIKYEGEAQELENLIISLKDLSSLYNSDNQFEKAYNVRLRISNLQDSLYNVKSIKQLHDAEVKYETDKKQRRIELLNKQATIKNLEINNKQLLLNNQNLSLYQTKQELNAKGLEAKTKGQQVVLLNKENTIQKLSLSSRNKTIGIIAGVFLLAVIFAALFYSRNKLKHKAAIQSQQLAQQETLTQAVIEAEEKERQRIASDLHDGVGQLFSAVKMNMNGLFDRIEVKREEDKFLVEKTMALVDESCKEVRSISHQMMPNNMLLRSGIASDVKSFIEKLDSESLKVNLEANGFKNRIESSVEVILYRVIQESVNNVIKHAKAKSLNIILNRTVSGITVLIEDDGIGFDVAARPGFDGIGLTNIETRIEYLKGTVGYNSAPGKGTRVNIQVPIA
jgi:two-component system NarL family sensor kinase